MSKKSIKILITVLFVIVAVAAIVFIGLNPNGDPTIDVPGVDNSGASSQSDNVVTITFPEGLTVTEIAEKLEEGGVCSKTDFINAVQNPSDDILNELGISNKDERVFTLEGYVFPDTYEFYKNENAESVLMRFVDNFRSKITQTDKDRAEFLGYTMDEIITIASIIQEESGRTAEDAKVSSVLHNRLKTGTKIECDVTITYLTDHCEPYLENGLTEDNKNNYNTYKCSALPKGPITNPGYASIQAALYPAETDFLFFVTDKDWNYLYASTWAEHVANCRQAGIEGY